MKKYAYISLRFVFHLDFNEMYENKISVLANQAIISFHKGIAFNVYEAMNIGVISMNTQNMYVIVGGYRKRYSCHLSVDVF